MVETSTHSSPGSAQRFREPRLYLVEAPLGARMAHGGLKEDYKTRIANAVAAIDAERWAAAVREFGRAQASLDHESGRHRRASAEISIRLADVYKAAGKYHLAGRAASHALRQLESCRSSPTLKAKALSTLAIVAWNRWGPRPALPYFESAADVMRRMKRPPISQRITVLDNLGLAYHSVGRLAEAMQVQRTSLALAQVHEAEAATRIKRRLANTLQDGGHFLTAHKLLREIRPSKGAGAIEKLSWYNASALLAERRGDIRNAVLYYREAQQQFFRLRPPPAAYAAVLSNSALLDVDLGENNRARRTLDRMRRMAKREGVLSTRLGFLRLRELSALDGDTST